MNMEMIQHKETAQFVCLFGKESLCLFRFLNVDLTQNQVIVCVCVSVFCVGRRKLLLKDEELGSVPF